jgi:hypothetical protein|tara:strand:- start:148 stop:372 length:225 start_codon:yes stop_codon:yes gene_type:complete
MLIQDDVREKLSKGITLPFPTTGGGGVFVLSLSLSRSTTTIIVMAVSRFFVSFVFRVLCDFDEHKENARDYYYE